MEPWDQTGLPGSSASRISLCYWLGTASSQCNRTSERFADCKSAHVVQMGGLAALDLCYSAMTIGLTWTSQSSHSPSEEHTYCLMKACPTFPTFPLQLHWHWCHHHEDSLKKIKSKLHCSDRDHPATGKEIRQSVESNIKRDGRV